VGKTENAFNIRFKGHFYGRHKYATLNQNSENLKSFALCVLNDKHPNKLYHLAEQVLLCLLGTYRSEIMNAASSTNPTQFEHKGKPKIARTLLELYADP